MSVGRSINRLILQKAVEVSHQPPSGAGSSANGIASKFATVDDVKLHYLRA